MGAKPQASGAHSLPAPLKPALAALAERAAAALEMDYAGVDLVPGPASGEIQVVELNGVAAWQGLQRVTGFNSARHIVDDLFDRRLAAEVRARPPPAASKSPSRRR